VKAGLGRTALRLLGPLLLVVVIARMDDPAALWRAVASAAPAPLCLALALNLVNIVLKVARWDVLLRTRGIVYPWRRACAAFLASMFLGMLTPGRVGDALRAQYLRHDLGVPYAEGFASVVMDRLCDLYVLALFVAFAAVRYSAVLAGELAWITWGGVLAVIVGPLLFLVPGVAERLLGRAYRKLKRDDDEAGLTRFLTALRAHVGRALVVTIPLTLAAFLINYGQGWLIAHALGMEMSLVDATCLLAIASLLGLLPISVSGLGVRELFFSLIFPVLGLSAGQGVSFGLVVFVVMYVALALIGFVGWQVAPPPTARSAV
jgi:uncharacterized protein (TIRG00374 family)